MSRMSEQNPNLPTKSDADIIGEAARKEGSFLKFLKFKKGQYIYEGDEVPLGSEYIAHCVGWLKEWVKFEDGMPVKREKFPVLKNAGYAPEREELGDMDESQWEIGPDRRTRQDPWSLQFQLPMEQAGGGDLQVFVTSSWGGKQAVADLCDIWARQAKYNPKCGMPIIKLDKGIMRTRSFGDVQKPVFTVVGWDGTRQGVREFDAPEDEGGAAEKIDDDIPF